MDPLRAFAICQELECDYDLIQEGSKALLSFLPTPAERARGFMLISSGVERFLKLVVTLSPDFEKSHWANLKLGTHNILSVDKTFSEKYILRDDLAGSPAVKSYSESLLNETLGFLSLYHKKGRYANLDYLLGQDKVELNWVDNWDKVRSAAEPICSGLLDVSAISVTEMAVRLQCLDKFILDNLKVYLGVVARQLVFPDETNSRMFTGQIRPFIEWSWAIT